MRLYLFVDKTIQNCASKFSQEIYLKQSSLEKTNLLLGTQISCQRVSKRAQQEGRKFKIWQEVDCQMSWQCGCGKRFEKVSPKTFPRAWSFTRTVGYSQSISALFIRLDFSEVIWLFFRLRWKMTWCNTNDHINGLYLFWDTIYIYIYIYCHPQTDCFVLSELFSVARLAVRSKPGSKPVQLYDRLRFQTTRLQADYVG